MENLKQLLEDRVNKHPEKTFIYFEGIDEGVEEISYRDFDQKVNRLAHAFLELGIKKGDVVSFLLSNCPEVFEILFACAKIGAILGPINNMFKGRELEYLLNHASPSLLVTDSFFLETIEEVRGKCGSLRQIISVDKASSPCLFLPDLVKDHSGTSTGKPKGVLLTHKNFLTADLGFIGAGKVTAEDRTFFVTPLFHANALLYALMTALIPGGSLVFPPSFSSSRFWSQVNRCNASILFSLGNIMKMLLNVPVSEEETRHTLRYVLAAAVGGNTYVQFSKRFKVPIVDSYGMTETCGVIRTPTDGSYKFNSAGFPDPWLEVKIVDDEGKELPEGERGEIVLKFENIMKGYYKNPEAMADCIKDGWFHTGDVGYKDGDGCYYFVDRKKDVVRYSGENISAREVEEVLNSHSRIAESAVVGVPHEFRGEEVKAFLVAAEGEKHLSFEEVVEYCKSKLAEFKIPRHLEYRESLPKTATGRVQKIELKQEARKEREEIYRF
ncbi:MAG: AMP-binding protein [Deltaproteobacteria bacterium]|nr:AMP-binding protein [Deltaproteobacteria bacterium]